MKPGCCRSTLMTVKSKPDVCLIRLPRRWAGISVKAEVDFAPWHDFQRWIALGNRNVDIPFAKELGKLIASHKAPRLRRDFSQILLAIKAHALLNQFHRKTDERGQIVAEIDKDYVPVAELM